MDLGPDDFDELEKMMAITSTAELGMMTLRRKGAQSSLAILYSLTCRSEKKGTLRGGLEDIFRGKKKAEFYIMQTGAMEPRAVTLKDITVSLLLKFNFVFGYFERQLAATKDAPAASTPLNYEHMKSQVVATTDRVRAFLPTIFASRFTVIVDVHAAVGDTARC